MKAMTMYRPLIPGLFERPTLRGFDHFIDSFFGESPLAPVTEAYSLPPVDIRETESAYVLDMELPGYEEKDIGISVDGSNLFVHSKQEELKNEKNGEEDSAGDKGTWILRERKVRSFSRSFKLPENADPSEVSAKFGNGILCLEIRKREEARKRTIPINTR